ncbi:MAG: DUF1573 domain-containing protein [Flavobacteriales bacterium]|nr:DUF1573 domain-containing protein [Flavobacteriales bacterium]
MSNGVKIGLLGVIAVLLGFTFFRLFSGGSEDKMFKPNESTANSGVAQNASSKTVQAEDGQWYYPGADGQADLSRPMDGAKKDQKEPGVTASAGRAKTVMTFEQPEHDFGTIKQGDRVEYSFKFTNTGKEPLIIEDATATCGCTVPQWPKDPIAPGKSDEIRVSFNSAGKKDVVSKMVTITANTEPISTKLTIKATVLVDPNAPVTKPVPGGH